ncbi:hypothetical protein EVAR_69317_1, partial [Eumeta japonica]
MSQTGIEGRTGVKIGDGIAIGILTKVVIGRCLGLKNVPRAEVR